MRARIVIVALLFASCLSREGNPRPGPVYRVREWTQRATGRGVWLSSSDVPARWRHLTDGTTFPVYVAFVGPMACVVSPEAYATATGGQHVTCEWRHARAVR